MVVAAAAVAAAATIGGAAISSDSSRRAAHTQADAANAASQTQRDTTTQGIGAQATATGPWRNIGAGALYQLANLLGIDPKTAFPNGQGVDANGNPIPGSNLIGAFPNPPGGPTGAAAVMANDPGYQFRLSEGQRGLTNSANAAGMGLSGASLKELDRFNQDYASNEFTNVFNRLADTAGLGQTAAQGQGSTAASGMFNLGNNIGSNLIGAGNANAAGQIGQANAITGGLTNVSNSLMQQAYLRDILGGGKKPNYLDLSNQEQVQSDINAAGPYG